MKTDSIVTGLSISVVVFYVVVIVSVLTTPHNSTRCIGVATATSGSRGAGCVGMEVTTK